MKRKNKIIFSVIAACILITTLILSCIFAFGVDSGNEKIKLIVSTTDTAVAANGEFEVDVRITNENISAFKVAGLQVSLKYDKAKVTAGTITHTLDTTESEARSYGANGVVTFVCVKNDFTDNAGYTTLTNLFKVKFKAVDAIEDPSALFTSDSVEFLVGDTSAMEVILSDSVYAGSIPNLTEAIIDKGLDVVTSAKAGTVVIVPTPANTTPLTKTELDDAIANGDVEVEGDTNGVVGTGSQISLGDESATIVVKGDVDGDGIVTVFDAMLIKEAQDNDNTEENFTDKEIQEFAGDVNDDNNTNDTDSKVIIDHVVGNDLIG